MISKYDKFNEALFKKLRAPKDKKVTETENLKSCGYFSFVEFKKDVDYLNKHREFTGESELRSDRLTVGNIQRVRDSKRRYDPYIDDYETILMNLIEIRDMGYGLKISLVSFGSTTKNVKYFVHVIISPKGTWNGDGQSTTQMISNLRGRQITFSSEEILTLIELIQTAEDRMETKFQKINITSIINFDIVPEFLEGNKNLDEGGVCQTCDGSGFLSCEECDGEGCDECEGTEEEDCPECNGGYDVDEEM